MKWNLSLWNRSRSNRPRKQLNTRLLESLENRALMAGDLLRRLRCTSMAAAYSWPTSRTLEIQAAPRP